MVMLHPVQQAVLQVVVRRLLDFHVQLLARGTERYLCHEAVEARTFEVGYVGTLLAVFVQLLGCEGVIAADDVCRH